MAAACDDAEAAGAVPCSRQCRCSLLLLYVNTAFLAADQNLMAPNLSQAAEEFGYDDAERDVYLGGYVALFFFVVGAPASILIGYFADRMHRLNLFVVTIWIGELACFLTYFTERGNLPQLLICRALTGVSVGGAMPVVMSLLADMYPGSQRAQVSTWVVLSLGAGIMGGQMLAGFVGPTLGWRAPFLLVAVPSLLLSLVVRLLAKEPARAGAESPDGSVYNEQISWGKVREIFVVPTNLLLIVQGAFGCVPWGVMFAFMNDFFAQDKGLGVETATTCAMAFGAGCAVGSLVGGLLGQRVYNQKPWLLPIVGGLLVCTGALPMIFLTNAQYTDAVLPLLFVLMFSTGMCVSFGPPNIKMISLNVNVPEVRGTFAGILSQVEDVGKGFGPYIVSGLISSMGRVKAFNLAWCTWIICGLSIACISLTLMRDERYVQHKISVAILKLPAENEFPGSLIGNTSCELPGKPDEPTLPVEGSPLSPRILEPSEKQAYAC